MGVYPEASRASSAGCGRFRLKVASKSPFVVTSVTFSYQVLRGFLRNFALDLSITMSKVHFTSLAVKGLPSCHLTPSRSLNVSFVLSALQDQLVARSGTMESMLFCATSCLYITRLLNTPMNGMLVEYVASSWIEALAGLSRWYIFRMPPCFCAKAAPAKENVHHSASNAAPDRRFPFMAVSSSLD